ncbi:cysteine synthase [Halarchaeum acidiphilum MH1-52-1]|uniref:Cysteine synthase n=1 Tax=Halarchaeum acidiphilum MH1-52-1 TaxID=1261545 RepID=U2YVU6_9EURY|nr:PLP-dependent cysteine synthase family protein [Halarchaeum acidiphilum]GAD52882.1 cysteine synthase [Halarchaeum acidiphilum MH1-52-1]
MLDSILDAIGTPLLRLPSPEGATVAAKLESFNPGGSAKDRPAREMVLAAEEADEIEPGDHLIEATSGNTGIGLAVVAAARGYDLTIVMPSDMSQERRNLLRAYGADLELVEGSMSDANDRAAAIADETDAYPIRQFENEANPRSHYRTTGEEILEQVDGRDIDAFVAGVGTGGTITGTGHRLREEFPDVEVVAVEPAGNAVLSGEEPGEDAFQGMGPGFVSGILDVDLIDTIETVEIDDAEAECRELAREQGVLVGQSSGAVSLVAQRVAERYAYEASDDEQPLVVTLFPDSGERYLSAGVFD